MKIFTLILAILMSGGLLAQDITLGPDVIEFDLDGTTDKKIGYVLQNNTNAPFSWYWEVEKADDFPPEWDIQVCDQLLCWSFGTERMPTSQGANILGGGAATTPVLQYVNVRTNGVAGKAKVRFCVFGDETFADPEVCTSFSTSTTNFDLEDLNIFPNPTSDYFEISPNHNIAFVEIYDIVGKNVSTFQVLDNGQYDVSQLRNGLYVVRLLNAQGKVVKSMRLSKR